MNIRNIKAKDRVFAVDGARNKRTVWTIPTAPFSDWTRTVRWQRAAGGEVSDGMMHIALPDCPFYGGLFDLVSTALDGERGDDSLSRTLHTCDRLSQEPRDGFVPIDRLHAWRFAERNLDSILNECFGIATDHSRRSHKMDLFVSTMLSCKPSDRRTRRILGILTQHGLSEPYLDMIWNNNWVDELADSQGLQTFHCIVGKHNLQDFFSCGGIYRKVVQETSHFATFPPKLVEPMILAGTKEGDTVLDPFHGAGTTGMVAKYGGRKYIGIELNPAYIEMSLKRFAQGVLL